MRPSRYLLALVVLALPIAACSASDSTALVTPTADAGVDTIDAGAGAEAASPPVQQVPGGPDGGGGGPGSVAFAYTPGWYGVVSVDVIGAFGTSTDWQVAAPFVSLTKDATGTFRASAPLPPGQYTYLFHVVGDAAFGPKASKYAVDPSTPAAVPCPAASPTYVTTVVNPCSQLSVPVAAGKMVHVRGAVQKDGAPVAGYFVTIERHEATQHHAFVNRMTTGADGAFDFLVVEGQYHVGVAHPVTATETDVARDPLALAAYKSLVSDPFPLGADTALAVPDMAFHGYASYAPTGTLSAPAPTHFTFAAGLPSRFDFFLANASGTSTVGDPVVISAAVTNGAFDFSGAYKATTGMASIKSGTPYFWGTQTALAMDGGSLSWKATSMAFPVKWP